MHTARWLAFGISNALTRTNLHFFPASDNSSAPYSSTCRLVIFGRNILPRSVVLEGGRLNHPDGLRLDDAFPSLRAEHSGAFGLLIEINTAQPRIDLTGSCCVVDLISQGVQARFWPSLLIESGEHSPSRAGAREPRPRLVGRSGHSSLMQETDPALRGKGPAIAIKDTYHHSSVLVVNGSEDKVVFSIDPLRGKSALGASDLTQQIEVEAYAVEEVPVPDSLYAEVGQGELSWGECRLAPLRLARQRFHAPSNVRGIQEEAASDSQEDGSPSNEAGEVAGFMVYRDSVTRRVMSVVACNA